ncbi:MAG: hypothetical protein IKS51_04070 [Erysipelotrichaceae bacterium]|nr:hypothetical protein [Erysipelotrichaceae bacterium]
MIKKILIIFSIVLLLSFSLFLSVKTYLEYRQDYVDVCVASHQISQRTQLSDKDIEIIRLPKQILNEDVLNDPEMIKGNYVKLSYSIPKGSLFYKTALESDIRDLANTLLMKGQVNYDLYTAEVKINSGSIATDMYVDLYLTVTRNDKPISDLLIRDCRITGLYDSNDRQILNYDLDSKVQIISLAIDEDEVSIINKALKVGELSVIVSNKAYQNAVYSTLNRDSAVLEYLE